MGEWVYLINNKNKNFFRLLKINFKKCMLKKKKRNHLFFFWCLCFLCFFSVVLINLWLCGVSIVLFLLLFNVYKKKFINVVFIFIPYTRIGIPPYATIVRTALIGDIRIILLEKELFEIALCRPELKLNLKLKRTQYYQKFFIINLQRWSK